MRVRLPSTSSAVTWVAFSWKLSCSASRAVAILSKEPRTSSSVSPSMLFACPSATFSLVFWSSDAPEMAFRYLWTLPPASVLSKEVFVESRW